MLCLACYASWLCVLFLADCATDKCLGALMYCAASLFLRQRAVLVVCDSSSERDQLE